MTYPFDTFSRKTVVVVEDENLVRELALIELEESGFNVIGFASADEALPYLRDHAEDTEMVFTDVQMPGRLNGLQLAAMMIDISPGIPVLVTSGGSLVDPQRLPVGATFLRKPWRPAVMIEHVRGLTTAAAALQAASAVSTSLSQ